MTITLHWWYLPIVLAILGVIIGSRFRSTGDYDFVTPILGLAIFLIFLVGGIGVLIGHFL